MNDFYNSLFWAVFGIALDRLFDRFIVPFLKRIHRKHDVWHAERLYYGKKTIKYLKNYYGNQLFNCCIGNTSKQVAFLAHPDWINMQIDVFKNPKILKLISTNQCDYPIRKRRLESRKKRGYRLDNNPSLFLHRIVCKGKEISFEVGEYCYFQRISFTTDFESETYKCAFFNSKRDLLRKRFFPKQFNNSLSSDNTVPIGCDTVLAIRKDGKYHICIHSRSSSTVNYPGGTMVIPSFGFGTIGNVNNPLLFSILREYCEELFDYEEMELVDKHVNPYWFYEQYPEVQLLYDLKRQNKVKLLLTGCGFDAIGGFFNLETLLIIEDDNASNVILQKCKGNWETFGNSIQFVPVDSPLLENIFNQNRLAPTSAFAIQRAIQLISEL